MSVDAANSDCMTLDVENLCSDKYDIIGHNINTNTSSNEQLQLNPSTDTTASNINNNFLHQTSSAHHSENNIIVIDSDEEKTTKANEQTLPTETHLSKRKDNGPYSENPLWEKYECTDFIAYRLLPNDQDLNGKAFAISIYLTKIDCRFNIGDIVNDQNAKRMMFLGVRIDKTGEPSRTNNALLYFCVLDSDAAIKNTTEGIS